MATMCLNNAAESRTGGAMHKYVLDIAHSAGHTESISVDSYATQQWWDAIVKAIVSRAAGPYGVPSLVMVHRSITTLVPEGDTYREEDGDFTYLEQWPDTEYEHTAESFNKWFSTIAERHNWELC